MPAAELVEHLQFLQPQEGAQTATLGVFGSHDLLDAGVHGCRKRFSNFAQASSSEWRVRMSRRRPHEHAVFRHIAKSAGIPTSPPRHRFMRNETPGRAEGSG
jgi:hypothetical protein